MQPAVRRFLFVVALCFTLLAQTGCSKRAQLDPGKINGTVYTNDFFKLQLNIPADWSVNGELAKQQILHAGRDRMKIDNAKTEQAMDASVQRTTQLLTLSRHPMAGGTPTSSFGCVSERLVPGVGIENGRDYLNAVVKTLQYSTVPLAIEDQSRTEKLGGAEFHVLSIAYQTPRGKIPQTYYARTTNGYALVFIVTVIDEADKKTTDEILRSIKFGG